ncbi:PID-CTERM protein-sorting domain-containing protein [Salisaeta longa]|uniref:PID-CTERM protein-sorting domain-containing protein n=1 Tax=Salisaeta longa TaxID=503170 RepID=UPI003899EF9A
MCSATYRSTGWPAHLCALVLAVWLLGPSHAHAQATHAPGPAAQEIPEWAQPQRPTLGATPDQRAGAAGSHLGGPIGGGATPNAPTLPGGGGGPSQVPVDGGIAWLAAAGAAYAARRLRNTEGETSL